VQPHAAASGLDAGGAAVRVRAPDPLERQVGEKLGELLGGVRAEHGLHPLLVLVQLQVALGECLAEAFCRPLSVAVTGAGGHELSVHFVPFQRCEWL
jgi:hypothetical protein